MAKSFQKYTSNVTVDVLQNPTGTVPAAVPESHVQCGGPSNISSVQSMIMAERTLVSVLGARTREREHGRTATYSTHYHGL